LRYRLLIGHNEKKNALNEQMKKKNKPERMQKLMEQTAQGEHKQLEDSYSTRHEL
jgi:hypothetical protein